MMARVSLTLPLIAALLSVLTSCEESGTPAGDAMPAIDDKVTAAPHQTADEPNIPVLTDRAHLDVRSLREIDARTDAVRDDPASHVHWHLLGESLHRVGQTQAALECYVTAARLGERHAESRFLAAKLHAYNGDIQSALAMMQEAADRAPDFAPAFWRLALLHLDDGTPSEAERLARHATTIDPSDRAAHLILARALLQLDDPAEAAGILEAHLANNARDGYARHLLGRAYRRLNRFDDADDLAALGSSSSADLNDPWSDRVQTIASGDHAAVLRSIELLNHNRIPEAVKTLREFVAGRPNNITGRINLGIAYRRSGDVQRAIEHLEIALQLGEHEMAHLHLAGIHQEIAVRTDPPDSEALARALHHTNEMLRITPGFAAGHGMLGELMVLLGDVDRGLDSFGRAIRFEPANPLWYHRRGMIRIERGEWSEAVDDLRRFHALAPDNPIASLLYGSALANTSRIPEGTAVLQAGLERSPGHPLLLGALRQIEAAVSAASETPEASEPAGADPEPTPERPQALPGRPR